MQAKVTLKLVATREEDQFMYRLMELPHAPLSPPPHEFEEHVVDEIDRSIDETGLDSEPLKDVLEGIEDDLKVLKDGMNGIQGDLKTIKRFLRRLMSKVCKVFYFVCLVF